ncbi:hypothetical protein HNQ02_000953 [Flavobacterium sp. 7E]|nr:hypothetical protein [Flavobacterium sp. 7E]
MIPVLLINNTIVNSSEVENQYCINNIPNVKKTTLNYTNSQRITTVKIACFLATAKLTLKKKSLQSLRKKALSTKNSNQLLENLLQVKNSYTLLQLYSRTNFIRNSINH